MSMHHFTWSAHCSLLRTNHVLHECFHSVKMFVSAVQCNTILPEIFSNLLSVHLIDNFLTYPLRLILYYFLRYILQKHAVCRCWTLSWIRIWYPPPKISCKTAQQYETARYVRRCHSQLMSKLTTWIPGARSPTYN